MHPHADPTSTSPEGGSTDAPDPIAPAEYARRIDAVRAHMDDQGLSALVVTDPANIFYLTGYNAWSFYTPQMVFVPEKGELVLFAREMDADGAWRTSWLPPESIVGYPERYVQRPHLHPFDWVAFHLRTRKLVAPAAHRPVGLEMDSHFFTPKGYRSLVNAIPEWTLVDCFELVNWVRAIKSPTEIALMHTAAQVTTAAMTAAVKAIGAGVRQCDVAAEISAVQAKGTPEATGDYPAIVPLLPTGSSADTPHLTWTDRRIRDGESVVVELAGAHHRYHVPLARTVAVGTPNPQVERLAEAVTASIQAVLDVTAPDVPVAHLAATWNRSLYSFGFEKPSRMGYSIGIGYPPDWGERTISLRSEDETILAENMTFHLIGGMWMDGYGFELSESIRITSGGVETFTSFPRGLLKAGDA